MAVVLAAVTFGGQKRHEAFLRFVTHKVGHSSVIAVFGDRGINVDAFQNRHSKKFLVPTPAVLAVSLIDIDDKRMKYTICIVAPLDLVSDHGPNKYSLLSRNTDDADTPVSSGRRPFFAFGDVPSAKGPTNIRANDEERGGRGAKKNECDLAL